LASAPILPLHVRPELFRRRKRHEGETSFEQAA
jgi:hypothetical protein